MSHRNRLAGVLFAGVFSWAGVAAAAGQGKVDLAPYLKQDQYERVKISPDGAYFAVTVPLEDRTVLAIIRRSDMVPTTKIMGGENSVVDDFWWANNERVVVSMAGKYGSRDRPYTRGELHAVNADGKNSKLLASPYGVDDTPGNSFTYRTEFERAVFMQGTLRDEPNKVLVSAMAVNTSDPYVRIEKLDIYTLKRDVLASAPVRRADFVADLKGQVRFAVGADTDNVSRLYYREGSGGKWQLVNDENVTKRQEYPLGLNAEGTLAYLQAERSEGPDAIVSWNPATGEYREVLRDAVADPYRILYDLDGQTPIGASYMTDRVRNRFFDDDHPTARLYRGLEKAFRGDSIRMTSATADGGEVLLYVWSDRNNGDYFLFNTRTKRADRVFSRREWFIPDAMPATRYVSFKARDGLPLHGYLTEPRGQAPGPRPLVLLPHGGPFGVFDGWEFDDDAQILAAAGYAVLRVNYRGSGNYGRQYMQAGNQEWGGRMQDDLTDATRWAVREGIADGSKMCIYGASYGGYAALMGAAREPDLYRCAVGYVGVYDLPMMHRDASSRSRSGRTWALEWMGDRAALAGRSPVNLADRIKVPVFLAAGGKDERAPVEHTRQMEKALKKAGVPVETLYYPNEGHGFYTEEHRREYYTRLLAFLAPHLGGAVAE
ncbi:S9 family peptidase [Pseudoxanthomonas daejeonensis]|uniref:Peptidase S9 n=1 Tax=Pseudoxanthomonas daejeonensis TaxID=266062 RepID=A0ABQ6Z7Q4_9GAMM|nr:S9 family peptidase [Pseudoxanthomonas daejeonensis]KAF1695006.1 peptidase S9 [Pseudoxanthomonas daejeonensis]UNK56224.1 S9 family peptidase [Pseudoxanthomonas daejeonensis]